MFALEWYVYGMSEDLKRALQLSIDKSFGATRDPDVDEKRMLLTVLRRDTWPDGGFTSIAKEILFLSITRTGPFAETQ